MVLLHTLVFWFIMLLPYAGFQCWKTLMQKGYSDFIPSFILFEKPNRGRMMWFYVLYCCCYTMVFYNTQVSFWHWFLWLFDWFFCLKAYAENWFCVPWYPAGILALYMHKFCFAGPFKLKNNNTNK